jgi:hypothetical protein
MRAWSAARPWPAAPGGAARCSRRWRRVLAAAPGLLLAACAATQTPETYPPNVFDHRVADGRVELYWSCVALQEGMLQIDGAARSPGSGDVRFMEVEAVGVNADGRTVGAVKVPVRDVVMHTNAWTPFYLVLRTTGAEARVDLYYQYRHPVERDDGLGGRFPGLQHDFQRSYVRDACAPAQHRGRA